MSATASRRSLTVIWRGFCKFVVRSSGAVLARLDFWGLFAGACTRGWTPGDPHAGACTARLEHMARDKLAGPHWVADLWVADLRGLLAGAGLRGLISGGLPPEN